MCGICGIIDNSAKMAMEGPLKAMSDNMSHRGPDDKGIYIDKGPAPSAGLGHRRLSIIDLSAAGHQPMTNEDSSLRLILNGEIYNYRELRKELKAKGHRFSSNTDSETVLHLYEETGRNCVERLRGMFAFAIWDSKNRTLMLARDRIGKKPLLYHYKDGRFCFASEFSSLLASGIVRKKINKDALHHYMTFGYIPAPLTIYEDVYKLPPGHTLVLKDGKIDAAAYWKLDYSQKLYISEEEAGNRLMSLLRESVGIRLNSDVPLGAFLSGGVDSSAIVALASEISGSKVKTFSIGFEEKGYDELAYARMIARRFDTEHREFIVKPNALEVLPLLVERYGEPYADSSAIPTYYVCRETKKHVTVALNGDGGDESFAGYERYQAMLASEKYLKAPRAARSLVYYLSRAIPDSADPKNKLRRIRRFFDAAGMDFDKRYLCWLGVFNEASLAEIYSDDFKKKVSESGPAELLASYLGDRALGNLDRLLNADTHLYLPDDLLVKVDIASMANSLEARSPFLDHRLMEFAASLPESYKLKALTKKYILKKSFKGLLPEKNISRAKMGFGVPVGTWFKGELKNYLRETVLSKRALGRGYFRPEAVRSITEEHIAGKKDYAFKLWALLMLELWHRKFMD